MGNPFSRTKIEPNPINLAELIHSYLSIHDGRTNYEFLRIFDDLSETELNELLKELLTKQNNPAILNLIGLIYQRKKDIMKATEFYQKASEQDNIFGCLNLGTMYTKTLGNYKCAFELFEKAHQLENSGRFATSLASMYMLGHHVKQDKKKAITLYQMASDAGCYLACCILGIYYVKGINVEKDIPKGLALLEKSYSIWPNTYAMFPMACIFDNGSLEETICLYKCLLVMPEKSKDSLDKIIANAEDNLGKKQYCESRLNIAIVDKKFLKLWLLIRQRNTFLESQIDNIELLDHKNNLSKIQQSAQRYIDGRVIDRNILRKHKMKIIGDYLYQNERNSLLETEVSYMPNGVGYMKCKEEFEKTFQEKLNFIPSAKSIK